MRFTGLPFKKLTLLGLTVSLAAFTGPQKDDLIELKGFLHGRNTAHFRASDKKNIIKSLKPGTRALIKETKFFTESKNYGMCLEVQGSETSNDQTKCVWVYYNVNNPNMTLYSVAKDPAEKEKILQAWAAEKPADVKDVAHAAPSAQAAHLAVVNDPQSAAAAVTTRSVSAIVEKNVAPQAVIAKPVTPDKKAVVQRTSKPAANETVDAVATANAVANLTIGQIAQFNQKSPEILSGAQAAPTPGCSDGKCNARIAVYQKCDSTNGYLEPAFADVMKGNLGFFQSPQKEIIRTQCIQRNLVTNGGGGRYKTCDSASNVQTKKAKACVSENYVNITSKSFNLAADCFGSLRGYSDSSKKQMALSIFSLMAQESGMHVNVLSQTNAGGPGQFTGQAISAINGQLKNIRSQLAASSNPLCSQVLAKALETPMSATNTCDRIAVSKDNPLKNIAYTFAYQNLMASSLDSAYFKSQTFIGLVSKLSAEQAARLKFSLAAWAHNTGPGGMQGALQRMLRESVRQGKILQSKLDVDHFLDSLKKYMPTHENKAFFSNIQNKVSNLELTSCLVN